MSQENKELYEFGPFRLDVGEHSLKRSDSSKNGQLPEKAFQALVILVRNSGRLLTKQDLIDQIWPDSFVEENNLDKCVHAIRHVLGEKPGEQKFIETVRKHGYRFVAPVNKIETQHEGVAGLLDSESRNERTTRKTVGQPIISSLTTDSGAFVVSAKWGLENDEDIVQENGRSHQKAALPDLLGPDETDNGGALKTEELVINGRTEPHMTHLAGSADRANPQTLPSKASRSRKLRRATVYAGVGIVLLAAVSLYVAFYGFYVPKIGTSRDRGTKNEEAYQLYQQAENLSSQRSPDNMANALDLLNQAVTLDPAFARAWAAKALVHRQLSGYPGTDKFEQYKKSMAAVEKALAIDPNLPQPYSALCENRFRYEYDFAGAESSCKRALELDPDSSVAHKVYATLLISSGRFDEAIAESKQAIDLQPLSPEHHHTYALALHHARRYEEEEDQWKRLLTINPGHRRFYYTRLFMNQAQQKKYEKAFEYLIKKLTSEDKPNNEVLERFRVAYAASGWREVTIERIKHPELESFSGLFDVACLYATLGDKGTAFEILEKAYQQHDPRIGMLKVEPQLDPLRDDARYADLVRRVEGK